MAERLECWESKGGTMVRALATHQCGLRWNPGINAICALSLLLVLSLTQEVLSRDFGFLLSLNAKAVHNLHDDQRISSTDSKVRTIFTKINSTM